METTELIENIRQLPLKKKFEIMEATLQSIKDEELADRLEIAAEDMSEEYLLNKELTSFTTLDLQDFYETK